MDFNKRNFMLYFIIYFFSILLLNSCSETNNTEIADKSDSNIIFCNNTKKYTIAGIQYKAQIVRYLKLNDGSIKIPIIFRKQPRIGAFKIYQQHRVEDVIWAVGPEQDYIFLPISHDIRSYIFLIRFFESNDNDWKIFSVDKSYLSDSSKLLLSEFEKFDLSANKDLFLKLLFEADIKYKLIKESEE